MPIPDWLKLLLVIVGFGMAVGIPFAIWADKKLTNYQPKRRNDNG